jgi:hypothetical protein
VEVAVTTITDQTPAVIDYLVGQCKANAALGGASPPVSVFDGPTISDVQLVNPQRIWIGADGPALPGAEVTAATFGQNFAFLDHAHTKDDTIDVACAAEMFSGDPTQQQAVRDGAFALMAAVETMLRGDTASGGPGDASMGGLVYWSQVTGPGELIQRQGTAGISALVRFHVTAFTRLTAA